MSNSLNLFTLLGAAAKKDIMLQNVCSEFVIAQLNLKGDKGDKI